MDANTIKQYNERCNISERNLLELEKKYLALKHNMAITDDEQRCEELEAMNRKLHFQINFLKRSIEDVKRANSAKHRKMEETAYNITSYLENHFANAVIRAYPNASSLCIVRVHVSKVADYQCNIAFELSKILKKSPREIANTLVENLIASTVISKLEVSGPGFINIFLSTNFIQKQISGIVVKGVFPPEVSKKKIVIDFSSPNIAKEMHVGHLRSTIIGEAIARLLEFLGHDVLRLNHLGDWGTQFGMLIAHLKDKFPDYLTDPPAIQDLQSFYKESKKRFDEDKNFKNAAYQSVVKLQAHDPEHIKGWQLICDISQNEFNKVYEKLKVTIIPRGESFYQDRMEVVAKDLESKGLLEEDCGRKIMWAPGSTIPLTIVKSDGSFTYDTSDMACIKQRVEEENADWIIYVTDAGQAEHFRNIFGCAEAAGYYDRTTMRIDHVTFGVVLGEDNKKFKTRSGDTVRLADLLNEGIQRAQEKLVEKERDKVLSDEEFLCAKEAVALGCIKYADLSHDRTRDYVFSFDRMLDFRGNTAAYLLYALTRIKSIARTAEISSEAIRAEAEMGPVALEHEKEIKLGKTLIKFPDVIKITDDLYLHPLCEYLYEVSTVFTEFYDNCYCVEKNSDGQIVKVNINRLVLCEATAAVMEKCFLILGIDTVSKM